MTDDLIQNIIDIPGVAGACLFHSNGKLYEDKLPSFYDKAIFSDLIRRVAALYEAIDDNYIPSDEYILKYGDITIRINRNGDCFLMVFLTTEASMVAVKMVSRMAIKNVDASIFTKRQSKPLIPPPTATSSNPVPVNITTPTRKRDDDDDDRRPKRHSYRGTKY